MWSGERPDFKNCTLDELRSYQDMIQKFIHCYDYNAKDNKIFLVLQDIWKHLSDAVMERTTKNALKELDKPNNHSIDINKAMQEANERHEQRKRSNLTLQDVARMSNKKIHSDDEDEPVRPKIAPKLTPKVIGIKPVMKMIKRR
jgi:hypothetical protein